MRRLTLAVLVATLTCLGCSQDEPASQSGNPVRSESSSTSDTVLRLYTFDCGRIHFDSVVPFGLSDDETEIRELAVPCYMIEHSNGRMLWDGGLASSYASKSGWQGEGSMTMRLEQTLAQQLAGMNLNLSSFDYVAFSHTHFDHVGVANEIEGATVIMQQAESDAAFGDNPQDFGFDPALYSNLKDAKKILVNGQHDVFGDGRVKVLSAPGHTPGHQVLWVDLANNGPVILSGDLYHFRYSFDNKRVPEFNFDEAQTRASFAYVDKLVTDTGAQFWIQHELAGLQSRKLAPAYYD